MAAAFSRAATSAIEDPGAAADQFMQAAHRTTSPATRELRLLQDEDASVRAAARAALHSLHASAAASAAPPSPPAPAER